MMGFSLNSLPQTVQDLQNIEENQKVLVDILVGPEMPPQKVEQLHLSSHGYQ
jgi:hypothetical protein